MRRKLLLSITVTIYLISQTVHGEQKQFMYDGEMRTYIVHDPSPTSGIRPLLIGLHCATGTAAGLLTYTDLIQKATDENFVGVFPNSLSYLTGTHWNVSNNDFLADDVGFISVLIDTMIKNYDIDSTRIYVTGHSNGSAMSYRLAMELSHRIAAIGAVSGQLADENSDPEYPVPIIHFHGLADSTAPYYGLEPLIQPVDSVMAYWCKINDCNATPDTILNENGVLGKRWASTSGTSDVILYTIEGHGHGWPVIETEGISATDVMWDFLELHTKTIETNIILNDIHSTPVDFVLYQNYPNPFNPSTIIKYSIDKPGNISLKIYSLTGQEIEILVDEFQSAGEYQATWRPDGLPSGLYFYKLQTGVFSEVKKLILQK